MSTGASKIDNLLKLPSCRFYLISEGITFQNFLRGMSLDPAIVLACFACLCALHTMSVNMLANLTSTMMTGLAVATPLFKSLDSPLIIIIILYSAITNNTLRMEN